MSVFDYKDGSRIEFTAGADLTAGDVVVLGTDKMPVVVLQDALSGAIAVGLRTGMPRLPLKSGDTPAIGVVLYWNTTNNELTVTAAGAVHIGWAGESGAAGPATLYCALKGGIDP
jgi:predicted RecA/RadA family phage recombinase